MHNLREIHIFPQITDILLLISRYHIHKNKEHNKEIKFSAILNGDVEVLSGVEKIEKLLENCMEICNKKYIVWQKGIGVLAKLNLWESGLENNDLEYDQLEIELEMFCQSRETKKDRF